MKLRSLVAATVGSVLLMALAAWAQPKASFDSSFASTGALTGIVKHTYAANVNNLDVLVGGDGKTSLGTIVKTYTGGKLASETKKSPANKDIWKNVYAYLGNNVSKLTATAYLTTGASVKTIDYTYDDKNRLTKEVAKVGESDPSPITTTYTYSGTTSSLGKAMSGSKTVAYITTYFNANGDPTAEFSHGVATNRVSAVTKTYYPAPNDRLVKKVAEFSDSLKTSVGWTIYAFDGITGVVQPSAHVRSQAAAANAQAQQAFDAAGRIYSEQQAAGCRLLRQSAGKVQFVKKSVVK